MDSPFSVLLPVTPTLRIRHSDPEMAWAARRCGGAIRVGGGVVDTIAFQLCVSVSNTEILAKPAEKSSDSMGFFNGFSGECFR